MVGVGGSSRSRASRGRIGAARALVEVEQGAHIEDVLGRSDLSPTERAAAWQISYGVLRCRGRIDAALRTALSRPLGGLDPGVRAVLRLGAWERLFGDAPDHAAVDQAVEVARAIGCGPASGLVNAVLRRARVPARLSAADAVDMPGWLLERWVRRYGEELAMDWAEANTQRPPITVVLRDAEQWPAGLVGQPDAELTGVVKLEGWKGPIPSLPGFAEGQLWVQDRAAVRVADLVPADGTVLDAAAAPGGKCFRLTSRGARVHAVDRDADRLGQLAQGAERLRMLPRISQHDWSQGPMPGREAYDAVLLDAPCTGLGTVRRHPEIKWRRLEPDIERAAETQRALLWAVAHHVRPGGALVYAVCSPEPEEGVQVVDAFLAAHETFRLVESLDTSPGLDGSDAHVAFRLQRGA